MTDTGICVRCGEKTIVKDSRASSEPDILVRRTRWCISCGHKFTTAEVVIAEAGGRPTSMQTKAIIFKSEIDKLVRELFGDSNGALRARPRPGFKRKGAVT